MTFSNTNQSSNDCQTNPFFSLSIFHLKQYFKHFFPFLFFLPSLSPSLVPPSLTPLHLLYAIPSFLPSFPSHHWTPTQTIIPSSPLTSKSSFLYFHSFISFPCFFSLTFFLLPSFRPLKKAGCRESHFWNKKDDVFMKGKMFLGRRRCVHEGEDVFLKEEKKSGNFCRNWN